MRSFWQRVSEGSLHEVIQVFKEITTHEDFSDKSRLLFFAELQMFYFRYEIAPLESYIFSKADFLAEHKDLCAVAQARLAVRKGPSQQAVRQLSLAANEIQDPFFKAELLFSTGVCRQILRDFAEADRIFLEASAYFEKAEIFRRSLRAELNALSARTNLNPSQKFFAEYYSLAEKARQYDDPNTEATCLMAVSREFQILSAYSLAYDYADQAVQAYHKHFFGGREHALALLHRGHLLFQLGRIEEATRDLYWAHVVPHPEVQAGARVLAEQFEIDLKTLKSDISLMTWDERKEESLRSERLSKLEEDVVMVLSVGPATADSLVEKIYGNKIDFSSAQGRLKNLLSRLRKKFPGLIVYENNLYHIKSHQSAKYWKQA